MVSGNASAEWCVLDGSISVLHGYVVRYGMYNG